MSRFLLFLTACTVAIPLQLAAQADRIIELQGRHAVAVHAGVMTNTVVQTGVGLTGAETYVGTEGFVGGISYSYWAGSEWSIGVTAGVLDAETSTSVGIASVSAETAVVTPLLFDVGFHPRAAAFGGNARPYLVGGLGPYVGSESSSEVGPTIEAGTRTDTAFGARLLGGIDWFIGSHFLLEVSAGYHWMSDFDRMIGSDDNYSGAEFSMGFGFFWGGGD